MKPGLPCHTWTKTWWDTIYCDC